MYSLCRERGGSYLGFCVCLWAYSGSSSKGTIFWQTFNSHLADFIDCGSRSASELRLEFYYNCCCLSNQVRSMVYSLPCSVLHRRSKVVLAHFSSSSLTSSPFLVRTTTTNATVGILSFHRSRPFVSPSLTTSTLLSSKRKPKFPPKCHCTTQSETFLVRHFPTLCDCESSSIFFPLLPEGNLGGR